MSLPVPTESEPPCPDCGNDPTDDSLHRDTCPRIDTCGQFGPPWIPEPWHAHPKPFETTWLKAHRATCPAR